MNRQAKIIFRGRVQGVGFRYTARHLARDVNVTGYVKNLPDGTVELVAEGEEKEILSLLERIETSQLADFIRSREFIWSEPEGCYDSFGIRF